LPDRTEQNNISQQFLTCYRAPTIPPVPNYSVSKQTAHREKLITQQNVTDVLRIDSGRRFRLAGPA